MAAEAIAPIVERIADACRLAGLTVVTAESCTGGLIADSITDLPGSSDWFLGGVVTYSDELKVALLGVEPATITAHGAVSETVARAMASGARERLGADLAVAVTGVAGPGGGSAEKPVGLVWIACASDRAVVAERHVWSGDRRSNKVASTEAALRLLFATIEAGT